MRAPASFPYMVVHVRVQEEREGFNSRNDTFGNGLTESVDLRNVTTTLDSETDVEVGELFRADNEDGFVDFVSEEGSEGGKVSQHSVIGRNRPPSKRNQMIEVGQPVAPTKVISAQLCYPLIREPSDQKSTACFSRSLTKETLDVSFPSGIPSHASPCALAQR